MLQICYVELEILGSQSEEFMMKKNICLSLLVLMLSACATENRHQQNTTSNTSETPQLGAPNPASQFCVEQGGQLQIKKIT